MEIKLLSADRQHQSSKGEKFRDLRVAIVPLHKESLVSFVIRGYVLQSAIKLSLEHTGFSMVSLSVIKFFPNR